ncbi:MAG: choice-of-anchor V domain-containing protein, partial [Acidobacteriota bacterium]|nr:choice-of-anchor V domain-containing protein [Acidobacteriota bacterium]
MKTQRANYKKAPVLETTTLVFAAAFFSLLFVASLDARSNGANIPDNNSVIGDMPCFVSGCHASSGGTLNDPSRGSVGLTGLPSAFEPGANYTLGVEIQGGTVYGVQIAVVFSDNSQAGTLTSLTSGVVNRTVSGTGILGHSFALSSGTVNFSWTAPTNPQETSVIFKVASNSANGNFDSTGDHINTLQLTVPQQTPPELTEKLFFAQFGNGTGLISSIVLTSPSATNTITGRIDFLDDDGLPFPVAIAGTGTTTTVDFSVPPLGTVTISTDGQGTLAVGSAVVNSESTLGGVIRFNISGVGIAGVGAGVPLSGFITPVRRIAGGINTGIAIYNTEEDAVTLELTLRDAEGTPVTDGTTTIVDFPAGGHLAQFIGGLGEVLFPDANTDDFQGTLVVQVTGGNVASATLELGTVAGEF